MTLMYTAQYVFVEGLSGLQCESKAGMGREGRSVRLSEEYEGLLHTFRIICASFSVSVGRILIEMRVRFFSLACACPQVSAHCVCVCEFVCGFLQVFML